MSQLARSPGDGRARAAGKWVEDFGADSVRRFARPKSFRTPESPSSFTSGSMIRLTGVGQILTDPHWQTTPQSSLTLKPEETFEERPSESLDIGESWNRRPSPDVFLAREGSGSPPIILLIDAKTTLFEKDPSFGQVGVSQYIHQLQQVANAIPKALFAQPEPIGSVWTDEIWQSKDVALEARISELFAGASEILFEDGIENDFSRQLAALVTTHGASALSEIREKIFDPGTSDSVVSEAMRCLGRIDHEATLATRRGILEEGLLHPSFCARNGAIFGLASMDDSRSLVAVEQAEFHEKDPYLKKLLAKLVAQLRKSAHVLPPETSPT